MLTTQDYEAAAKKLGCDVAAILAFAEVESSGKGFLDDGKVRILFEGHWFSKFTKGKWDAMYGNISYLKWTNKHYAKGPNMEARGQGEWKRFEQAMRLDREAAIMSASYGKFQVIGFNYALCEFATCFDFFLDMMANEQNHLKAFVNYILNVGLDDELRRHDWARLAYGYNGPLYRRNEYDSKLAKAYVAATNDGVINA